MRASRAVFAAAAPDCGGAAAAGMTAVSTAPVARTATATARMDARAFIGASRADRRGIVAEVRLSRGRSALESHFPASGAGRGTFAEFSVSLSHDGPTLARALLALPLPDEPDDVVRERLERGLVEVHHVAPHVVLDRHPRRVDAAVTQHVRGREVRRRQVVIAGRR